jgi:class 3 adenylate cyclase/tetratricopeptide (TPR) repeat protein
MAPPPTGAEAARAAVPDTASGRAVCAEPGGSAPGNALAPYVPRLLVEWAREAPEATHRAVAGTLAFVDISGFTTMTERLARHGRVGAEEVSDTLDACFARLLAEAYSEGAGLVKWGGDAVLLLFDDEGHAARACRGAGRMQRALRAMGPVSSTAGRVRLRMSVGVHTGTFHFFLAGDLHRELIVAGPAASAVVELEAAAETGEVMISEATAAALAARNVGAARGPGRLLRGLPDAPERPAGPPDVRGLDLAPYLPLRIREHLLAEAGEAEHRQVGVAFVEFAGSDDLLAEGGPEALGAALDTCVRAVQRAAHAHDVTFLESDVSRGGGKIMLVAGAPRSAGHDEERLLQSVRELMDGPTGLPLRAGVNYGRVFAGDFGPPFRRTYSVKGDAVNTAARVMGRAATGEIIATEAVLARSRTRFHLTPLEPLRLKGKALAVEAALLGAVDEEGSGAGQTESVMVGREAEVAALEAAVAEARSGRGRVVEIVGEPGMGKSRLAQEAAARAAGMRQVTMSCQAYAATTPYRPVSRLLRRLVEAPRGAPPREVGRLLTRAVAELRPDLRPWLPLVAVAADAQVDPTPEVDQLEERFRRARLEESVAELLSAMLSGPALIHVEDAHWMDEASAGVVDHLARLAAGRPWMMICTRREDGGGLRLPDLSPPATSIRLEALPAGAAAELAEAVAGEAGLPAHAVAAITGRAGGNPLFLRELVVASRRAGGVEGLPDSVEGVLTAQIDHLAPADRALLRAASVLGGTFTESFLADFLGVDDEALDEPLWGRLDGFLLRRSGGEVAFRHALVRDAAYEGLPFRRRRALHARAGEVIERRGGETADERADVLSLHYLRAGRYEAAWRYSKLAGRRAEATYASVEALEFYRRALEAVGRVEGVPPGDVARVWEAVGDAEERVGIYGAAAEAYRSARRHASRGGDLLFAARMLRREAEIAQQAGRYTQSLRLFGRGRRMLGGVPGDAARLMRAELAVGLASVRFRQGRHAEAAGWCELAIADAQEPEGRRALAWAYHVLDGVSLEREGAGAIPYGRMALALYEELGDLPRQASVVNNLGGRAYYEGRWAEAQEHFAHARELYARTGDEVGRADAAFNTGEVLSHLGRFEEARAALRDALRVWRAAGDRVGVALATAELGRIAYCEGDPEAALALLEEARAELRSARAETDVLEVDVRIAECHLFAGRSGEALAGAEAALDGVRARGGVAFVRASRLQRIRGYALLQQGRREEARDALGEAARLGDLEGLRRERALALLGLARLADGAEAERLAGDGQALLDELGVAAVAVVPLPATPR